MLVHNAALTPFRHSAIDQEEIRKAGLLLSIPVMAIGNV